MTGRQEHKHRVIVVKYLQRMHYQGPKQDEATRRAFVEEHWAKQAKAEEEWRKEGEERKAAGLRLHQRTTTLENGWK